MWRCCTFFCLFCGLVARSQDVTGIWRGHFRSNEVYQRLLGDDDRYKMEVQIAQAKKYFQAVTYSYKSTIFYGKAEATGSVDAGSKKVLLKELKIVELRMIAGDACIMTCFMQYSKLGDDEFLEGTYTSRNTRDSSDCGRGTIFLHKVSTTDFYKEPFLEKREKEKEAEAEKKKPVSVAPPEVKKSPTTAKSSASAPPAKKPAAVKKTVVASSTNTQPTTAQHKTPSKPVAKTSTNTKELTKTNMDKHTVESVSKDTIRSIERKVVPTPVPKVISNRSNELVKTITVNSPDVQLNIYDDGTIDNDTVSVYFDNKLVVSKARLTDQAIVVNLHLDESAENHEVVMVAENLGDIPPNTSLMVVKAGDKRYEVRIVSTEQKNAVVLFKYEKPQ
ncbi:MAG: hypothetical protein ACHQET_00060 [Chitinophagales bacterium]